jgi:hypothetical protein
MQFNINPNTFVIRVVQNPKSDELLTVLEELDGLAVTWRAITKVQQCWSVIGWMTKGLIFQVSPCFGLILAAFAVTNI